MYILPTIQLLTLIHFINAEEPQCYADIESPYLFFSHRTSYNVSRSPQIKTPENCNATYLWALIRHGTRYNSAKEIGEMRYLFKLRDQIVSNREQGRGELCEKDFDSIRNWTFSLNESLGYELTETGKLEEFFLAKRLKEKFPNLLASKSSDDFIFQTSGVARAVDSAIAFTNELLQTKYDNVSGNNITDNQQFLHLVKICTRYENEIKLNSSVYEELNLFKKSYEVNQVLQEVSKRLGFDYILSYDEVELMYKSCAYENAWYINSKPAFCAPFTEENLKVFEYTKDLENYYEGGYGHPMNEKLGCELVRDMMMTFSNVTQNNFSNHKASIYFSHSEMILPLIVKLGLHFDEEPLKHDNYNKMKERKWKLAMMDNFSGNIIAVLFKCSNNTVDENQVVFYQNEYEIILPGCSGSPCSLKYLQQRFEDVSDLNKCNSEFCYYNTSANSMKSKGIKILFHWYLILSVLVLLKIFIC